MPAWTRISAEMSVAPSVGGHVACHEVALAARTCAFCEGRSGRLMSTEMENTSTARAHETDQCASVCA